MSLFNRYDAYLKDLDLALWEGNNKYCNPKDYFVTEEECRKYIEDLKIGQKQNREWNERRKNRWIWLTISLGFFFTFCLPLLVLFLFNLQQHAWGIPVVSLFSWSIAWPCFWGYNKTEEYFSNNKTYWHKFFPPVNENIERLFDDYLWKEKLERMARSKDCQEEVKILQEIENSSHPYLPLFKHTIETELSTPSDIFVLGDIKFGMTPEEVNNTNVFKGIECDDSQEVYLGYRGSILGNYFGLHGVKYVSILYKEGRLSKMVLTSSFTYKYKADIVEPFINCCRVLNQNFGNPQNHKKKQLGLCPMDRADFCIGRKCISLSIGGEYRKNKLVLEFSRLQKVRQYANETQYEFCEEWFDEMRYLFTRYDSNPYTDAPFLNHKFISQVKLTDTNSMPYQQIPGQRIFPVGGNGQL